MSITKKQAKQELKMGINLKKLFEIDSNMTKEKNIKLLGVVHGPEYIEEVKKTLINKLRPGQSIGFEVSVDDLKTFEKIFQKNKSFEKEFSKSLQEDRKKFNVVLMQRTGIKINFEKFSIKKVVDNARFFYELFVLAKRKGLVIYGLDSRSASRRHTIEDLTTFTPLQGKTLEFVVDKNRELLSEFLLHPSREKIMAEKIIKFNPDFVVVGRAHLDEIKNRLKKKGIKTKIIYKTGNIDPAEKKSRVAISSAYWQKIKIREKIKKQLHKGNINDYEAKKMFLRNQLRTIKWPAKTPQTNFFGMLKQLFKTKRK